MGKDQLKRMTRGTICLLTDWTEADWLAYQHEGNWWHRNVGTWASLIWFRAHNNRLYRWCLLDSSGKLLK